MFQKFTIKTKLLTTFIIFSLIPLVLVTLIAIFKANQALEHEVVAKFTAIQEAKAGHIRDFFATLKTSVKIIKNDPYLQTNIVTFNDAFEQNGNTVNNSMWETMVGFKEPPIKAMVKDKGFYDLLLISPAGNIVYTAAKGPDLGMNIPGSDLAGRNLGKAFQAAVSAGDDDIFFADFQAYDPGEGAQAAFMVARMKDQFGEVVGYVAVRIPGERLSSIVQQRSGMGETGETFLVGKSDGTSRLRSDRLVKKKRIGSPETNAYIESALNGEAGSTVFMNSDGVEEFIRYDPVGVPGLNWAMITTAQKDEVFAAIRSLYNTGIVIILAVAVAVIAAALGLTAVIIRPVRQTVDMLRDIAEGEGDLTKRLTEDSRDEMGEMAVWFNTFMGKIQAMIRGIAGDAADLNRVSSDLSAIAGTMTGEVESMSARSGDVTRASGDMSGNMSHVAALSEDTSANVNIIAAATEEMAATVSEIANNSEKARSITDTAVSKADDASAKVDELGIAAEDISKVIDVITDISDQTNLLALNATIEAARAGEAGKGFAVVANEIKELATQTASATLQIKERIDGMQVSTSATITHIDEISRVINDVNDIVTTIAASVEEQSVTSQEIANNVATASQGIQDMNDNMAESAASAKTISGEMSAFEASVRNISDSSNDIRVNSGNLSGLADKLNQMVGRFKI
ncbi:MAG: methyl-accepting chemotaxis protein [Desulfobacter sp.]